MSGGISRVHGGLKAPVNNAGVALQDFQLIFWNGDLAAVEADWGTPGSTGSATPNTGTNAGGAFDQIFRTAVETIGTVSRVGTLGVSTANANSATLNFAVEVLGVDPYSSGYLGDGSSLTSYNTFSNTAAALQAAVNALGTTASIHLSSATVVAWTY